MAMPLRSEACPLLSELCGKGAHEVVEGRVRPREPKGILAEILESSLRECSGLHGLRCFQNLMEDKANAHAPETPLPKSTMAEEV